MKKTIKILSKIIFIVSILIFSLIIISNFIKIIRILFFGITVGKYPDSIWFTNEKLIGINGLKTYYKVYGEITLLFDIPMCIFSLIYQFIYLKLLKNHI